jgi:hypothetical protein
MSDKSTPGPWKWMLSPGYEKRGWVEVWSDANECVVRVDGFERHREGETEHHCGVRVSPADADLITAAPELRDALQGFLDCVKGRKPGPDGYYSEPIHSDEVNAAIAAIARATGVKESR